MISKKSIGLVTLLISISLSCQETKRKDPGHVTASVLRSTELFHIPYVSSGELNNPALVLVLHGDAPFNNPSYQYRIAKKIAIENTNVVSVGILRPGYTDNEGNQSKGERGNATGDNYTIQVLESIYALTTTLKEKYNPSEVVLVGHSGGGAISANLIAAYPGTYSKAVLISCPCDLDQWRAHMKKLQPEARIWDMEVSSLSPIENISSIDDSTQIGIIHGDKDEIVPIGIAYSYRKALESDHKTVNFLTLENQGHEVALNPRVFELVKEFIK
ncbi:Alpha/beta hydrolase family protein [Robiginitalea myxolifaciens]|uniref:Alpha/beta hydrolase family protein n=1 Tax=Robiginitalea myxolifaciens TaxID=400055 RepID=A0A1I6HLP0_9FLAO|nr:prolyl oligopeptidase family serine peptidase [Robiginitalea myxolifaciens]SFR55200.1 Alpha/beta hydrolase family protein [Robiginitalea myxolifaciens]